MRLDSEELLSRLRLIRSENIGDRRFAALLARFGTAKAALAALQERGAMPPWAAAGAKPICLAPRDAAERELAYAEKIGVRFVALGETDYPLYMKESDNPPPLLAVKGALSLLQQPALAVVGSRNASAAGQRLSGLFAHAAGQAGFAVCSGFARGIDTVAHKTALQTGTIAVMAGGLDHIYPPENKKLYQDILAAGGAFVSEMPLGFPPRAVDFPRRNRLIASLSLGLLVAEASERSGSLITARYAAEAGRLVFAVPGSPLDPRAKGANSLIKNGACLADCPEDILEMLMPLIGGAGGKGKDTEPPETGRHYTDLSTALGKTPAVFDSPSADKADNRAAGQAADSPKAAEVQGTAGESLTAAERRCLQQNLSPAPIAIDNLAQATQMPLSRLYLGLVELELAGRIIRHHGGMVSALPE